MKAVQWDIFLSYVHSDRKRVRRLARRLAQKGWSVWWDWRILPGQPFDTVIEQALKSARCVIVVWSQSSIQSDWVKDEAAFARTKHKLIPILMDAIPIPLGFGRLQTANLVDWDGSDANREFRRLLGALGARLGKPESNRAQLPAWLTKYAKIPLQNLADDTADLLKSGSWRCLRPFGKSPLKKTIARHKFIDNATPGLTISLSIFFLILVLLGLKFYDTEKTRPQAITTDLKAIDSLRRPRVDTLAQVQTVSEPAPTFIPTRRHQAIGRPQAPIVAPPVRILRCRPDTLADSEIKAMLHEYGFYDSEWNPRARVPEHRFQLQIIDHDSVVLDPLTGLMWQQSGSRLPMAYADAVDYIHELNRTGFAAFSDWRMPTLAEAMSLVRTEKSNGFLHLDEIFDTRQCWIWTVDLKKGFDWHWIVIFIDGRCYENIFADDHFIRAVRTSQ